MNILIAVFMLLFSSLLSANTIDKGVIFGDSLSDNGNLYRYMNGQLPMSPPYYQGRFTNGLVWVEYLIESFYPVAPQSRLLNYAFGGAGILEEADDDDTLFTLRTEIETYLLAHQNQADAKSLYVIWIGANNYLACPTEEEKAVKIVMKGIKDALNRLVEKGAKNILILNLPDLGATPGAREFNAVDLLTSLSKRHNQALREMVFDFRKHYPQTKWVYMDVEALMNDVLKNPSFYGFSNTDGTCYDHLVKPASLSALRVASTVTTRVSEDQCNGYLFFDVVHPSTHAHRILAEKSKILLRRAGIEFEIE